jgi:peroxiredoxin-like protein
VPDRTDFPSNPGYGASIQHLPEGVTEMNETYTYHVKAKWEAGRNGIVSAQDIHPPIHFSAPPEFRGETGFWTPEHFLLAAVASCFVATFYAIAAASKLEFVSLQLCVEGMLGKPEGKLRFTEIVLQPSLMIAYDNELERAKRILEKAEEGCLIARSLSCPVQMETLVRPAEELLAR